MSKSDRDFLEGDTHCQQSWKGIPNVSSHYIVMSVGILSPFPYNIHITLSKPVCSSSMASPPLIFLPSCRASYPCIRNTGHYITQYPNFTTHMSRTGRISMISMTNRTSMTCRTVLTSMSSRKSWTSRKFTGRKKGSALAIPHAR